ncbi:DoxX family protein [Streptomyces sp. CS057]|uniref:DoxX family protein n=1 Tax=Streptomyces sp. CS057 TaxID=1982764 RepID=UPI000B40C04D|nr:DoxX family protein [Streptomyces sp. CS057]OWA20880.1 transmembrane invasion protein [Streptomyces sp. CS057]
MTSVLLIATVSCAAANVSAAIADFVRAPFVLANSAEVRVPPGAVPYLAALKLAGAVGLVVGLVAFFVGAVLVHVRARVFHNIAFPGGFLLLAVAATVHFASGR